MDFTELEAINSNFVANLMSKKSKMCKKLNPGGIMYFLPFLRDNVFTQCVELVVWFGKNHPATMFGFKLH